MEDELGWTNPFANHLTNFQQDIHGIHVWYIYLHLLDFYGKCRYLLYTIHGSYGYIPISIYLPTLFFLSTGTSASPSDTRDTDTPRSGRQRLRLLGSWKGLEDGWATKRLPSLKLTVRPWKWMVGILLSYWGPGLFSTLVSGRVSSLKNNILEIIEK